MGILPAEITQRIIHLLVFDWVQLIPGTIPVARLTQDAGRYAAVSRAWQDVVERETFADLRLDQSRLARLRDIATPRRRGYVRTIRLDAVLPRAGSLGKPESHGEALRNDAALQATFEAFLQTLSQWSAAEMHPVGVALSVDAWAPVDLGGGVFGPEYRDRWAEARRRRHEDSALELTDPESIWRQPKVEGIISLKSSARNGKRRIAAAAMCSLLARLPAARTASFEWWHDQEDDRMRSEFHDALLQVAHPMDSLRIIGTFNTPVNRLRAADAPPETDALSQTIRAVSQRLKSCSLYHVAVSEEIFFPLCLDVKDGAPHWQRLEGFYLNFPPATPCGQLLFETEPAAAGSDDEDAASSTSSVDSDSRHQQRRLKPGKATAKMQRFHLAAARAALEMPLLKNMVLTADLSLVGGDFLEDWHAFSYRAKGPRPTAVWTSSSGFVPEDDVLTCWREVSTRHAGAELEVKIVCDVDAV